MLIEKWLDIKNTIKDKFEVENQGDLFIDEEGGIEIQFIEFTSPFGKIRLEHVSKPVVVDKKTTYSKRIGSETNIEYIYSETEKSRQMLAYRWDDNAQDWDEIDAKTFSAQ